MSEQYFNTRYSFDCGRAAVWRAICEYLQRYVPEDGAVLDLGCGYGDFINAIRAGEKYAVDRNPEMARHCSKEVSFICADIDNFIPEFKVDVIFMSNLLEHFSLPHLERLFDRLGQMLKPGGKILIIQPNYYYSYRSYWDDYTHVTPFSHHSLKDFCASRGFNTVHFEKKFLPFSMKSWLPKSYWLTKIYLQLPYRIGGAQMLAVMEKSSATPRTENI